MRSMVDVQSAFMRMDVNGDGTLTKREMLAADEFTQEEVGSLSWWLFPPPPAVSCWGWGCSLTIVFSVWCSQYYPILKFIRFLARAEVGWGGGHLAHPDIFLRFALGQH